MTDARGRSAFSPETLADVWRTHATDVAATVASFDLKGERFDARDGPRIMGVINLSRDSWYRESVVFNTDAAIRRALRLSLAGADVIDIGAESSLRNAARVGDDTQLGQLLPIVQALQAAKVLVSVETYSPKVASAVLSAGAAIINLTGTRGTEAFYREVAEHNAGIILCYVAGDNVREVGAFDPGHDPIHMLTEYFSREIERAQSAGVSRIWIDPGLGFYYSNLEDSAARVRYQIQTLLGAFRLRALGWPICNALPHAFEYFEDEVRTAEAFFAMLAILGKTDLLRTHETAKVRAILRALRCATTTDG